MYFKEAYNTLMASWIEIKLAKLFGRKTIHQEEGISVTIHRYRGKLYLTDMERDGGNSDD